MCICVEPERWIGGGRVRGGGAGKKHYFSAGLDGLRAEAKSSVKRKKKCQQRPFNIRKLEEEKKCVYI